MRGRLITIGLLGLLVAATAVAPALAGHGRHKPTKHYATNISITTAQNAGTIEGNVSSPQAGCADKREITLYVDGDKAFSEKTTKSGHYGIVRQDENGDPAPLDPGDYQVKAQQLKLSKHKVCDAGKSKVSHLQ